MRIAALGDIHSNHYALEACIHWIENNNINGIAFLGDYLTDCPYPQKTMTLLKELSQKYPSWFVRGNREDYLINHHKNPDDNWCYNSNVGSLLYTYNNLTCDDLDFFEGMPISLNVKISGYPPFTICHGTPDSNKQLVYAGTDLADQVLANLTTDMLLGGHSHVTFIYESCGKTMANGGSVGCSVNGQNNAQFTVIESHGGVWQAELISVEYDVKKAIDEIYTSDFIKKANVWARAVANILLTGNHYILNIIDIVKKLSQDEGLPFETEELWQRAAKQLGI